MLIPVDTFARNICSRFDERENENDSSYYAHLQEQRADRDQVSALCLRNRYLSGAMQSFHHLFHQKCTRSNRISAHIPYTQMLSLYGNELLAAYGASATTVKTKTAGGNTPKLSRAALCMAVGEHFFPSQDNFFKTHASAIIDWQWKNEAACNGVMTTEYFRQRKNCLDSIGQTATQFERRTAMPDVPPVARSQRLTADIVTKREELATLKKAISILEIYTNDSGPGDPLVLWKAEQSRYLSSIANTQLAETREDPRLPWISSIGSMILEQGAYPLWILMSYPTTW